MVKKLRTLGENRNVVKACGFGVAIYLLAGLAMAWGQDAQTAPADPSVADSKVSAASTPAPNTQNLSIPEYMVSPEDLLEVVVMDVPEVSRTYRVSSNGFLNLPLLSEPLLASGQTLEQLSQLIATKFRDAGMLNNAQVSVSLKETRLHTVLVSGEVKSPGSYPIFGPSRLIEVLVKAGGISPSAGDDAIVSRGVVGAKADVTESARTGGVNPSANGQSFTLHIRKLVDTGDDTTNVLLYPGDRVTIQRAEFIYVMGAVARPGGYVLSDTRQHVTVLKALAMAGDVTNVGKRGRILLLRKDPATQGEKRQEIPIDYTGMVKGKLVDIRMVPDDILFVPESGGLKAMHAATTAAIAVASTGGAALLVYH